MSSAGTRSAIVEMERRLGAPLLPSDDPYFPHPSTDTRHWTWLAKARLTTKRVLASKAGHYAIIALVTLDVACIFAGLILQTLSCERRIDAEDGPRAQKALGIVSLVFSCLFVVELLAGVWAFGPKRYFRSWFRRLDGLVIIAGFVLDVILKGVLEEVSSRVVVLRLYRVCKIIEELSGAANERIEPLHERIEALEEENKALQLTVKRMRLPSTTTEQSQRSNSNPDQTPWPTKEWHEEV